MFFFVVNFLGKLCFFKILLESMKLIRYNVLVYTLHNCAEITNCKYERNGFMSASNKKQLRKEQQLEMLTAKQRQEQAEAKKLKTYTITFVAIMVAVALLAVGSLVISGIKSSGVIEKNTVAATVNGQNLNAVELNYYYNDAISKMYETAYEQYSSYYELYFETMGLDLSKPLNEQTNSQTGKTWAEFFVDAALDNAKYDYTFAKLAEDNGFTLPEDAQQELNTQITNLQTNTMLSGYSSADSYLKLVYGAGSDIDSYKAYLARTKLADAYYQDHYDSLTYTQDALDAHAKDKVNDYNSYDYSYVYLSYSSFQKDGTENEDGTTTYTDEQKDAARAEAKKTAEELFALGNLDDIRNKVNEIEGSEIVVNDLKAQLHTNISKILADWLSAPERTEGEIGLLENASAAEEGKEAVVNGYYVICFTKKNDNTAKMSNVRHLLVEFEGGEEDEISGEMNYSAAKKEAAKTEAEKLLQQWKDGASTEESFIELIKEHTDDAGSATTGGLYEDIHPASQYVPNFLSWSINPERKAGDVEIVETEYGYHIMYFTGYSELSYRDQLITNELKSADIEQWKTECLENATATTVDLSKTKLDLVISG